MTSLNVVHVVATQNFAGVERHVAVLANAQSDLGLSVRVLGGQERQMRHELHADVEHRRLVGVGSAVAAVRALTKDADLIHAHMTAAEAAALFGSAGRRTPVVATRHFAARRSARGGALVRRYVDGGLADQISVSEYVAAHVDGASTVVHAGVEERAYRDHHWREPYVLMAQRIEREKSSAVGLDCFAASGLAQEGWRLLVAGGGKGAAALRVYAAELGLADSVDFLGFRSDIFDLMDSASVFLATSDVDAFGLSVVEAMASATPVVAARAGGHLETVGARGGEFLFPPGDSQAGGLLLRRLAMDEVRRDLWGSELRDIQRSLFTTPRQAAQTSAVYARALGLRTI